MPLSLALPPLVCCMDDTLSSKMVCHTPQSSLWKWRKGARRGDIAFFEGHVLMAFIPLTIIIWPQGHLYSTLKESGNYSLYSGCLNAEIKCFYMEEGEKERNLRTMSALFLLLVYVSTTSRRSQGPLLSAKSIALICWVLKHSFCEVTTLL